ncbi:hypothetical protein AVEN_66151-1 [Araneus ventricosus]|uniref:Uncharacterized protein n=1 Tax=Araneus ventricosus TaxID=182803 RepID=A0A4Y2MGR8_ARAVE|nr:hypothetical protein AVEN_66151-1 [Araneus ventricosus]
MATCQPPKVKREETHLVRDPGCREMFQYIPSLYQITCNRGRIRSDIGMQQRDTFREQSRSFPANCLVKPSQRGTISGCIHVHSTRMEINQQHTLVIPKDCDRNFLRGWHCFQLLMWDGWGDEGCLHVIDAFFVSGALRNSVANHASINAAIF